MVPGIEREVGRIGIITARYVLDFVLCPQEECKICGQCCVEITPGGTGIDRVLQAPCTFSICIYSYTFQCSGIGVNFSHRITTGTGSQYLRYSVASSSGIILGDLRQGHGPCSKGRCIVCRSHVKRNRPCLSCRPVLAAVGDIDTNRSVLVIVSYRLERHCRQSSIDFGYGASDSPNTGSCSIALALPRSGRQSAAVDISQGQGSNDFFANIAISHYNVSYRN